MKIALKEKKGFTLVELLAVIVVLAIVMVLATTTVLPLMEKSQKAALATEANSLVESASQAVSLISINSYDGTNSDYNNGYCFTVANLKDAGLWKKTDTSDYAGYVTVKESGNNYEYYVKMHNADFTVSGTGNISNDSDAIVDYTAADTDAVTYACPVADADGNLPEEE